MKVYRAAGELPVFRNAVVTIGTFDGVHTGHQQIIQQLKQEATAIGGETVIITFDPHPRQVIFGSTKKIQLINTLDEKIELLAKQGIDHLAVMPFTESFSQFTAEQYIREFLVAQFRPHTIIIGYDHRFGKGRAGDYHLMEAFSADCGYQLKEIPVHLINLLSVSSTRIRSAISEADISTANELLGYPFFFEAKVVAGARLGRTIGYPTANLQVENDEKIVPGNGVYAVQVAVGQNERPGSFSQTGLLKGMMNIGMRPTVDGTKKVIEVNIFDFDQDLYEKTVRVYVIEHLRPEQKFNGLDELKAQLKKDREQSLLRLKDY